MKRRLRFYDLTGRARARCLRLLHRVRADGWAVYVRRASEFRDARRLYDAGLATVAFSRPSWGRGRYPFRELAVFADEADARRHYPRTVIPRRAR